VDDNKFLRMMHYYTETACQQEDYSGVNQIGVEENLPRATITFDRYHIMKLINAAVDSVRKAETKGKRLLRGQKYLFLKNRENLTESKRNALHAIESMLRINLKIVRAYHIRENFQEIYKEETQEGFKRALKSGIYGFMGHP